MQIVTLSSKCKYCKTFDLPSYNMDINSATSLLLKSKSLSFINNSNMNITRVSQTFWNILLILGPIQQLQMTKVTKLYWTVKYQNRLIFYGLEHGPSIHASRPTWSCLITERALPQYPCFEAYMIFPDTERAWPQYPCFKAYMIFPDHWESMAPVSMLQGLHDLAWSLREHCPSIHASRPTWSCLITESAWPQYPCFKAYMIFPDHWDSGNPREISSTNWLLYCDKFHLHLSCNIFGYFHGIMAQFKLIKHTFLN